MYRWNLKFLSIWQSRLPKIYDNRNIFENNANKLTDDNEKNEITNVN